MLTLTGLIIVALIALGDRPRSQKIGMIIATAILTGIIGLLVK